MMATLFLQIPTRSRGTEAADLLALYWPVLLPVVLGFVAVYLLLPRARRYPPLYGAAAAGLALLAAGALLIRAEWATAETILFYTFAGLAVVFGTVMITQQNPVHAALSFAMVVLSTCGLFLLQAAPFLMAATIIIYAGAIVVTFLFVIMLAQQEGVSSADQRSREPFLATVAGFVLLGALLCVLQRSYSALDRYVDTAERAAKASTLGEWQDILGKDSHFFADFSKALWQPAQGRKLHAENRDAADRRDLALDLDITQGTWNRLQNSESPETAKEFKQQLAAIVKRAVKVRDRQGALEPQGHGVSPFSQPSLVSSTGDESGKSVERLPAGNVAALGKSLFTDYLLAVELAGTLLLVATIGAIAIAGRRPEGLR